MIFINFKTEQTNIIKTEELGDIHRPALGNTSGCHLKTSTGQAHFRSRFVLHTFFRHSNRSMLVLKQMLLMSDLIYLKQSRYISALLFKNSSDPVSIVSVEITINKIGHISIKVMYFKIFEKSPLYLL